MKYVNIVMNGLFSLILKPFRSVDPWWGMLAVSLVSSVVLLLIFKFTSNQRAVKLSKDRFLAYMLELALFRHDVLANMRSMGRMLIADLAYIRTLAVPLCVGLVPFVLIAAQLSSWFGARPLREGESFIVTARFADEFPVMEQKITVEGAGGIQSETYPVRVPLVNEMTWRFRAGESGSHWIDFNVNGQEFRKEVAVGPALQRISRERVQSGVWRELLNPAEPVLPDKAPVTGIEVIYPEGGFPVWGVNVDWFITFMVLTLLFAVILKKPLGVNM